MRPVAVFGTGCQSAANGRAGWVPWVVAGRTLSVITSRPSSRRGFTLLELLVIVAVLGLLLAMLLPALSAASEAGRAVICGTRLNQFLHGSYVYTEANDGTLPYYGLGAILAPPRGPVVGHAGRQGDGSV